MRQSGSSGARRTVLPCVIAFIALASLLSPASHAADRQPLLPFAFAHNDYLHERPLFDALELGFCAVEADIFLTNNVLLVGHDWRDLRPQRTLQKLYLDPLARRVRANGGKVHRGGPECLLLIDIKTEAEPTYEALKPILAEYRAMLTSFRGRQIQTNAIRIVLSGERPIATVSNEVDRLAAIDGRIDDLGGASPVFVTPLVSDNWTKLFKWRGVGEMPDPEKALLREFVAKAHQQGRQLRLWAAPDLPSAWKLQKEMGVDFVNTDRLKQLADFFNQ